MKTNEKKEIIAAQFGMKASDLVGKNFHVKYFFYLLQYLFCYDDAEKTIRDWHRAGVITVSYCGIKLPKDTELALKLDNILTFNETNQVTSKD